MYHLVFEHNNVYIHHKSFWYPKKWLAVILGWRCGVIGDVHNHNNDLPGDGRGLQLQLQEPVGESAQVFDGNLVLKPG